MNCEKPWFALRTQNRHEKAVRDRLVQQGIEQVLPIHTRFSRWKDRKKRIEEPLFPGYCFARFVLQDKLTVLQVPGVMYVVSSDSRPVPVPTDEIDALRRLATSGVAYEPHPSWSEGTRVEILRGPLSGLRGRLIRHHNQHYVLVGISLLQQGATVRIAVEDVAPVR